MDKAVPKKNKGGARPDTKKWMDRETLATVREKHKLFRRWQKTRGNNDYTAYIRSRNKASRECRKVKRKLEATVAADSKITPRSSGHT